MLSRIRSGLGRVARSYVLFVVLGLVIGLVLAPLAFSATSEPQPTVAVVPLEGSIDGASASAVAAQFERARDDPSVEAVVIVSNSGGGTASGSETLYLSAKRLAASDKPVYAAVDASAASGAYYTIAPADRIYAKPSSFVGSVGVRAAVPANVEPNEVEGSTGPNKLTGFDTREFYYLLESNRRAFVGAVFEHRGETLTLSRAELSEGQVYSGGQAVNNGLVDAIGGRRTAIDAAARAAGLDSYRVQVFRAGGGQTFLARTNYLASRAPESDKRMVSMERYVGTRDGLPTLLMVPGSYVDGPSVAPVETDDLDGSDGPGETDDLDGSDGPGETDRDSATDPDGDATSGTPTVDGTAPPDSDGDVTNGTATAGPPPTGTPTPTPSTARSPLPVVAPVSAPPTAPSTVPRTALPSDHTVAPGGSS